MIKLLTRNKHYWGNREFMLSVFAGLMLLVFAIGLNYYTTGYATESASNHVADLLLDNLPVVNMDIIVVQGAVIFILGIIIGLILYPRRLPFILKAIALFILIRSIFITLTHMAPYLGIEYQQSIIKNGSPLLNIAFGGDLFFSGHTGVPFLLALSFWRNKYLRILFLILSIIFSAAMLLSHLHYSIDIFAAYFITYSIFCMAKYFFAKDYKLFVGDV